LEGDFHTMQKLYVIGDSISIQYGPYLQRSLQGVVNYARKEGEEEAMLDLDNPQGANGGDSSMVLAYLQAMSKTARIDTDVYLINCGLHDIKTNPVSGAKQVALAQYQANLRAITEIVAATRASLIWVRTTPCDESVHNRSDMAFFRFAADGIAYNEAADSIMADAGIPAIDLYNFTRNLGPDLYCDHVHFHEAIREKQGIYIAGWLASWVSIGQGLR
jgi:lysophospholipase L1-like esterase